MNTNPGTKRVLCFGDSNTWGYIPGSKHERYPANVRWTGVLQNELGPSFEVIEEGLNSRGILKGDLRPGKEGRSAAEYIGPCLDTHDPLDFIIVFLGTNELKAEFNLSPDDIGRNLGSLIALIAQKPSQFRKVQPKILIVVPPVTNETTEYASKGNKYVGAQEKSIALRAVFKNVAENTGAMFLDKQTELRTGEDGVHMLAESHMTLGKALAGFLR